ncbi:hypothetical protein K3148_08690 [Qipengyuania aurantiaca]|uniref:Secreted protein n=1 Tax=Qipengyuania aurantiaca TaxID=2867233 RepID=A0ABX8ZIX0_9SPHN|nr:hypothetical protein [Qipengyuania aurantiaca]QZD88926.1 hypothetical protein K3148_08690 [Qipengyuania aurantiaca]
MTNLHRSLILGASAIALSACGADEIVSPGTGGNVTINNGGGGGGTPTPTPTSGTLVTPAAGCPTISDPVGLTDSGTISGPTGEYRVCTMPARFTASSTLPYIAGLVYRMNGRVDVGEDGGPAPDNSDGLDDTDVELTIEPGVIVYASGSSFLNVNRGNTIQANGTAARPIIFTSRDNVQGLNTDSSSGQWGGVVLSGRAPVTDCIASGATPGSVNCERQVEGAAQPAIFGGATPGDSSGSMSYVQIRYSGFVLSGDSELQSLTTGGTGSGTTLNHIMSYNSSDDGVEFFGGRVNVKNLIVVGAEDDSIDTDTGVKANLQYVIAIQRPGAGDTIIEADSDNAFNDSTPRQDTRISNATFVHQKADDQVVRIRGFADYRIANSVIVSNQGTACLRVDGQEELFRTTGADEAGPVAFDSLVLDCDTPFRDGSGATAAEVQGVFDAGTNTNSAFTNTLTSLFLNGSNEDGVPVFDVTAWNSFFELPARIGAVYTENADWVNGWTCKSSTVTFDANTSACTSLPVYN